MISAFLRYSMILIAAMAVGLLPAIGAFAEERECPVPESFYAFEPPLTKTAKALAGRREVVIAVLGGASTMGVAAGGLEFAWPARLASALAERFPSKRAKVINLASVDGIFVNPIETYSYAASKAAVIHLTRRMATKLVKDNINVTAIAPGAFKSDMNRAARDHADEVAKRIPAKRIGTEEDMAGVAIYLASRAGDYVVGNTIAVDGGVVYANAGLEIAG